jgi:hypothetical protein
MPIVGFTTQHIFGRPVFLLRHATSSSTQFHECAFIITEQGIAMGFNLMLFCWAVGYTSYSWSDPALAFGCGLNLSLAVWCFCDFVKEAFST